MRKLSIRWLLPILVLLVLVTALALVPLVSHAASPTTVPVQPNAMWPY